MDPGKSSSSKFEQFSSSRSTQPEAGDAEGKKASSTMSRIGRELLSNSKAAVSQNESLEKDTWKTRDLLSLLVRANVATDLAESQRMLDEDVLARAYYHSDIPNLGITLI